MLRTPISHTVSQILLFSCFMAVQQSLFQFYCLISTGLTRPTTVSWWYPPWHPRWLSPEVAAHPWTEEKTPLSEFLWSWNSSAVLCFMSKQEKYPLSPQLCAIFEHLRTRHAAVWRATVILMHRCFCQRFQSWDS